MSKTRIYFVSDLHGSSVCFRKFINAAKIYDANVLILGGDVAGKAIQSIVRAPGGRWRCRFVGTDYDVVEGPELVALEKLISDHGYYPYRADPGELEAMEANGGLDDLFLRLMRERLTEWLDLADARLRPLGIPLYFMLGNDDPEALGALLDSAPWGTHDEGKVVWLDDEHEMISCGYSNVTPWHTYREQDEAISGPSIDAMVPASSTRSGPCSTCTHHPSAPSSMRRRCSTQTSRSRRPSVRCAWSRWEHRRARRRAGLPADARAARPHPRVPRASGGSAARSSSTRAATTRRARSTAR